MRTRNNRIKLDRANGAADNISTGEKTMRNASTKTPWHLRFAPGAILRKIGSARTVGGAEKNGLLEKTTKGIVSFLQNLLPSRTQKDGVRPVQKAFRLREIFQTAGIGILLTGFLVVFIAPPNAQAQKPDYYFHGTDMYKKYKRKNIFSRTWYIVETETHSIEDPQDQADGYVRKTKFAWPPVGSTTTCDLSREDCPKDHFVCEARATTWYKDNTYTNLVNIQRYCQKWSGAIGAEDYEDIYGDKLFLDDDPPRQPPPAANLDGKQETVGALWIGGGPFTLTWEIWDHFTDVTFVAKHKSGTRTFNILIKYRIDGSTRITTIPKQITLSAGGYYEMSLRVPNRGTYADVVGIDISDTMPPSPPSPAGGRGNPKVSIGIGPIEVEIPERQSNGQSANQEDASDRN